MFANRKLAIVIASCAAVLLTCSGFAVNRLGVQEVLLLVLGISLYFVPTFIARHKKNGTRIIMLNIFLGWTLIGWIVALVWAHSSHNKVWYYDCPKCGYKIQLDKKLKIYECPHCRTESSYAAAHARKSD